MTTAATPARPLRVVFVCTANMARSAYAGLRAAALAGPGVDYSSAGVLATPGRHIDPPMAAELDRWGIDSSGFVSRRTDRALVAAADLVLTMTGQHREMLLRDHPSALGTVFTIGQFADVLAASEPALRGRELIAWAGRNRPRARPDDDVADPYGRGQRAARDAAETLDAFLEALVPRLSARA